MGPSTTRSQPTTEKSLKNRRTPRGGRHQPPRRRAARADRGDRHHGLGRHPGRTPPRTHRRPPHPRQPGQGRARPPAFRLPVPLPHLGRRRRAANRRGHGRSLALRRHDRERDPAQPRHRGAALRVRSLQPSVPHTRAVTASHRAPRLASSSVSRGALVPRFESRRRFRWKPRSEPILTWAFASPRLERGQQFG